MTLLQLTLRTSIYIVGSWLLSVNALLCSMSSDLAIAAAAAGLGGAGQAELIDAIAHGAWC